MVTMKLLTLCFIGVFLLYGSQAKIYERCEFARTLLHYGFSKADIPTWTCIVKHESNFNTKAINKRTGDYGIFQISHYYWCSDSSKPGKGCNITCASLLDNNIKNDVVCAQTVYRETRRITGNGFSAWVTYNKYCRGDNSKYIAGCF